MKNNNVELLQWLGYNPDMKIIENVQADIKTIRSKKIYNEKPGRPQEKDLQGIFG